MLNRIAQRRQQLGLSQEDLAELIGTSQHQISRYETGKNKPTADVLLSLSIALQTSVDYLLGNSDSLYGLNDAEKALLEKFRDKTPDQQRQIMQILEIIGENGVGV